MTIHAKTLRGSTSASAVYQIEAWQQRALMSEEHAGGGRFRGEAIMVDLPSGPMFALMQRPDASYPLDEGVTQALLPDTPTGGAKNYVAAVRRLAGSWSAHKAELPRADWPLFVRFTDINHPDSIEAVDPASDGIDHVTVETTSDAISTGIEQHFPAWFGRMKRAGVRLNGKSGAVFSNRLDDNLSPDSFSTELRKVG